MTFARLGQYYGERGAIGWRNLSMVVAIIALPFASHSAAAQSASDPAPGWVGQRGVASVYSSKYNGRRTALGTRFDQHALTAAHAWLPLGTKVRVTSLSNGDSVVVTVTDRMSAKRCVIDLSAAAARLLGMVHSGLMQVAISPAT
jgi:rare lipoprotein A